MNWLFTNVYNAGIEIVQSGLLGMSSLSGDGTYTMKSKLNSDEIQQSVDNQCYAYHFKVKNDKGEVVAMGLSDDAFNDEPLITAQTFLLFNTQVKYLEYYKGSELVNILCINVINEEII